MKFYEIKLNTRLVLCDLKYGALTSVSIDLFTKLYTTERDNLKVKLIPKLFYNVIG